MATIAPRTIRLRDGRTVLLRSATVDDAPMVIDLLHHLDRTTPYNVTQPDERDWSPEHQRALLARHADGPCRLYLAAVPDDAPHLLAGTLSFENRDRRIMAHHGHFGIGLHEDYRGAGLGRAMVQALLDWAAGHPIIEKVCLGCFAGNTHALRLYRRMGFEEEGVRRREFKMPDGSYVDDVQMAIFVKR